MRHTLNYTVSFLYLSFYGGFLGERRCTWNDATKALQVGAWIGGRAYSHASTARTDQLSGASK